jgi:hypothetical protein
MATRVYLGTLGAGVLQDASGNVQAGQSATVKVMSTGANATHYSARTGGSSSTASITTSSTGTLERWVAPGAYTITVGASTYDFHAPAGDGTIEPIDTVSRALEVYTTNPTSGRKERFSIENNQDAGGGNGEVDINFRNCTINVGSEQSSVSTDGMILFQRPSGSTQNPIVVYEAGETTAGAAAFFISPHGTVNAQTYGFATNAFQVGAFNEAERRFTILSTGMILRGPGGSTAPTVGMYFGTGTPEGAVTAAVGSTYQRSDGGAGTSFYVKESGGTGNTGWVGK